MAGGRAGPHLLSPARQLDFVAFLDGHVARGDAVPYGGVSALTSIRNRAEVPASS